jgi:two-component system CheB/CheR fusion protein
MVKETSKEELQSLNEELSTVNNQLQDKVDELDKANNDMTNLLASTDIATIFFDPEKRIQRFTPATAKLLNLIAADVGCPIGDFSSRLANAALLHDVDRVLERLTPLEKDVYSEDGECYLRRVTPYRTQDNRLEKAKRPLEVEAATQLVEQMRFGPLSSTECVANPAR